MLSASEGLQFLASLETELVSFFDSLTPPAGSQPLQTLF